jgi:RNA polymerase sigma-70 factor (ECF subfamily)
MLHVVRLLTSIVALEVLIVSSFARAADEAAADQPAFKHHDGSADGKKSLGGSGEMIRFALPEDKGKLAGIKIHGSRYGQPQAPNESFLIYIVSPDRKEVVSTQMAPYSLFERGEEKWVDVRFSKPVEVPKDFWIALDFRAGQTKGVYVSYDTSSGGKFSKTGLPGLEAKDVDFAGDWMVEAMPVK